MSNMTHSFYLSYNWSMFHDILYFPYLINNKIKYIKPYIKARIKWLESQGYRKNLNVLDEYGMLIKNKNTYKQVHKHNISSKKFKSINLKEIKKEKKIPEPINTPNKPENDYLLKSRFLDELYFVLNIINNYADDNDILECDEDRGNMTKEEIIQTTNKIDTDVGIYFKTKILNQKINDQDAINQILSFC